MEERLVEEKVEALFRWSERKSGAIGFTVFGLVLFFLCGLLIALRTGSPFSPLLFLGLLVGIGLIIVGLITWMISKFRYNAHMNFIKETDERKEEALKYLSGHKISSKVIDVLEDIGGKYAAELVIHALKDKNWTVRVDAAWSLGNIGDPLAIDPLINALEDESEPVRATAAGALGKIGDRRVIEPLVCTLTHEIQSFSVRESVAKALDRLAWNPKNDIERVWYLIGTKKWNELLKSGKTPVEPLIITLKQEKGTGDSDIRIPVATLLGMIKDTRAIEPLTSVLKDENSDLRKAAKNALDKIQKKGYQEIYKQETEESRRPALSDAEEKLVCPNCGAELKDDAIFCPKCGAEISYALAYSNRGFTYGCLKQYERAIEDCNNAIELDPNLAGAYTNRGNAYNDLGQYERAIKDYNKAIELNPNDTEAYDNRELLRSKLKEQEGEP